MPEEKEHQITGSSPSSLTLPHPSDLVETQIDISYNPPSHPSPPLCGLEQIKPNALWFSYLHVVSG